MVIFDFRTGKIPNRLCAVGALTGVASSICDGIVRQGIKGGAVGGLGALVGLGLPIILLFILHRVKALGAGDIKLLAMAGSFLGIHIIYVIFYSFFIGGIIALIIIISNHLITDNKRHYLHFSLEIFLGFLWFVTVGGGF